MRTLRVSPALLAAVMAATPTAVTAADPGGVLSALDVCDALGVSGLTLSSDSNCLQVSGGAYYEFYWGDYETALSLVGANPLAYDAGYVTIGNNGSTAGRHHDWISYLESWLQFVSSADSDVGPAKAVVKLYGYRDLAVIDEAYSYDTPYMQFDYAYVSVGDRTVLSAGIQDTIANLGDDEAFGWLPTFMSDRAEGVAFDSAIGGTNETAGHAINVVHNFGNGLSVGSALEALQSKGSAVGFVAYGDERFTGHLTLVAGSLLDGSLHDFALHAGATAVLDSLKLRAALAATATGWWDALASAEAKLGIFTLSGTVDATSEDEFGAVVSASIKATDALTLKAALRWVDSDASVVDDEGIEVRARIEYAATEFLTLAAEGGTISVGPRAVSGSQQIFDGLAEVTWNPGGGFTGTVSAAANSLGALKFGATATKTFE